MYIHCYVIDILYYVCLVYIHMSCLLFSLHTYIVTSIYLIIYIFIVVL